MDDTTKAKLAAGTKIAVGSARMASAILTATGHGIIGTACRNHHMMHQARRYATYAFKGGKAQFDEGLADWRQS